MQCSKSEFVAAIEGWRDSSCAVHVHTDEISGAFVVTFRAVSQKGVLEFQHTHFYSRLQLTCRMRTSSSLSCQSAK
jgi:hypothetical protein